MTITTKGRGEPELAAQRARPEQSRNFLLCDSGYRVITNGFPAEYGKGGAFVNDTVLKSGSNDWHGSAFEYNRVQAFAANDFFSNASGIKDHLVRNQFGGSAGGPVVKDKTFFYATYERHTRREASPIVTTGTTQDFIKFVMSGAFETFMETNPAGFCVANFGPNRACPGRSQTQRH